MKLIKLKFQGLSVTRAALKGLEADTNISELSKMKNKFRSTLLEERLNYLYPLSIETDITGSLSREEAIKVQSKKYGKSTRELTY